jgi:uncharacterized membrane protein
MYFWVKALSIIGIILAVYLLTEQFLQRPVRPCTINATINCDAIVSGAVSKTLGLPTPLYGLIGYVVVFISAVKQKSKSVFAMSSFGLAFCLRIAIIELFQLHVVCPVCLMCQTIMIVVFILAILLMQKDRKKNNEN